MDRYVLRIKTVTEAWFFYTVHTDLLQCMLGGVQCRLDSSVERVRRMGMVVGECISRRLDTPTSQLKFQVTFHL